MSDTVPGALPAHEARPLPIALDLPDSGSQRLSIRDAIAAADQLIEQLARRRATFDKATTS